MMKYKVTSKVTGFNLPHSHDDMLSTWSSFLWLRYGTGEVYHDMDICNRISNDWFLFKAMRLYDYIQSEVICKIRARKFTKHLVNKQIFGK